MSDVLKAIEDSMIEHMTKREDARLSRYMGAGKPFRDKHGVVHVVYADYETLCDQLVRTLELSIGWEEVGYLYGTYVNLDTPATCLACLAEGAA